jgi:hypothetical protein
MYSTRDLQNVSALFPPTYVYLSLGHYKFLNAAFLLLTAFCSSIYNLFYGHRNNIFSVLCEDGKELPRLPSHNLRIIVDLSMPPLVIQTDQGQKDPGMAYRLGG